MKEIPINTAKEQLVKINKQLKEPHLLIGGLAVQQYHSPRTSSDIDLICNHKTMLELIDALYSSRDYEITEDNGDDYRPAYTITSKTQGGKVILFGPKITEREPYAFVDWDKLKENSQPYVFKSTALDKISIPTIEALAFTKLLSFLNRIISSKEKGINDLRDFINLSNNTIFKTNCFIDLIRTAKCGDYIKNKLDEISGEYEGKVWHESLLFEYIAIIESVLPNIKHAAKSKRDTDFKEVFATNNSISFYDKVATLYDARNTKHLYEGHQAIIGQILELLPKGGKIVDIGCGTGRLIASHFKHDGNISWLGIDGSSKMLELFKQHTHLAKMKVDTLLSEIMGIDFGLLVEADLCLLCFTLTSLPNINCMHQIADKIKPGGYLIVADIHPSHTINSPYYDFELKNKEYIALKPNAVYPDKIIELLLPKQFVLITQRSILDGNSKDYAFVSIFRRI